MNGYLVINSTFFLINNIMDEKEIFEDQIADYWIDYYKSAE
ncbi:hypothetical protein [Intestinibacter sp.]